jgi:hypothetical protein
VLVPELAPNVDAGSKVEGAFDRIDVKRTVGSASLVAIEKDALFAALAPSCEFAYAPVLLLVGLDDIVTRIATLLIGSLGAVAAPTLRRNACCLDGTARAINPGFEKAFVRFVVRRPDNIGDIEM